jgi:hypothetical protein
MAVEMERSIGQQAIDASWVCELWMRQDETSEWQLFSGLTLMPIASSRRSSRRFRTANGNAGFATRQVSSRNTRRPSSDGMAYKNEGTSSSVPHMPSPEFGCFPASNLRDSSACIISCLIDKCTMKLRGSRVKAVGHTPQAPGTDAFAAREPHLGRTCMRNLGLFESRCTLWTGNVISQACG